MPKMHGVNPLMEVRELQRTIAFYRDVLGFELQATWPEGGAPSWCRLTHGGASLMFAQAADGATPSLTGRVYFYPDDTAAYYEQVKTRAEIVMPLAVMEWGMREFTLRDPDGYLLSFGEEAEPHEHDHGHDHDHEHPHEH